jgi:arginyl-tRNA synthetase
VDVPKDLKNGDYASSFAMAAAKSLKLPPRTIAQAVLDQLRLEDSFSHPPRSPVPAF